MIRFLGHWLVLALSLAFTAWLLPGVLIHSWAALAVGSLMLGAMNALVRPVLAFLTWPLTVLTLGLFYLVVNGVSFGLAACLVGGFAVESAGTAILGALITSVVSTVLGWFLRGDASEE